MPTRSIIEPMCIKAEAIEAMRSTDSMSESMKEIIQKNQDLYKNVGNKEQIKSLKI